jgi:hypothetical protein
MSLVPKDPLLTAARLLINFFIAVLGLAIVALTVVLPALLLNQERFLKALAADGITVVAPEFFIGVSVTMVLVAATMAIGIWFLLLLRQIVGTVAAGDPFIHDNADRLSKMGWIALGAQVVSIPLAAAVVWIAGMVEDYDSHRLDDGVGFDGGGIVLILVLFILARVFRQGAAMREDLEGTV